MGEGVGQDTSRKGRGQWMFTRKGKALQNKVQPRTLPEPFHMETGEQTGRKDFPKSVPTQG